MSAQTPFTDDEIAELRKLLEIEKIRKVIQLYSQLMDARDIDAMVQIYTEDAVGLWGPFGTVHGRDQIYATLTAAYPTRLPYDGLHCTTNAWIELTGPDTAVSRAYLIDVYPNPEDRSASPVVLYGTYENDYRKVGGDWKIARSALEILWPDRLVSENYPRPITASAFG